MVHLPINELIIYLKLLKKFSESEEKVDNLTL
jgi:hypothetical protein